MKQNPPNLNDLLGSAQAHDLLRNKDSLEALMKSGEAQRLMELLNQNAGDGLKDAAKSAMSGDAAPLMKLVEGLMRHPESSKLVEQLNKKVQK